MNRAEENNDLYGQSPKGENIMFKKKLIAAGMTAFAITTMAGITALASQEFGNQNMPVRNMQNQNFGESFDKGFERGGLFNSGNIAQGMMNNGAFDESNIPSDMPQNKNNTEGFSDFENSLSDTDNDQSGERPEFGGVDNQSDERSVFGGADNQPDERPEFGGGNNQSTERPAFEGGNNQSTDNPTFGTGDNQSGNRPSLGRKSDEEAMKEGNPTPELPDGVTVESTGIENMNNSAFGLGGMMEQGFSAGNSSQYFDMNQNARDGQSYNVAEDSGISAYRPAFAGSDNQSTDQPIFEAADNNQSGERLASGGVDNQSTEKPAFGGADNQSGKRSAFEGGNSQSDDRPTFGTADNQSGNRPSLGRKSDEEAMKEGNPRPELPEGVTADDAGVEV